MSSKTNITIMGLPSTGKTTFLAALWHIIETPRLQSSITLTKINEGTKYLQTIHKIWEQCEEFERTKIGFEGEVNIPLQILETEETFELSSLDPSGESYENNFEKRACSPEHARRIRESSGILFFIHPNEIYISESIELANTILQEINQKKEKTSRKTQPPKPWKPENCSTQVRLVDLLQFIIKLKTNEYPIPMSIIISAWDLIQDDEENPEIWIQKTLPLFYQYLKANSSFFSFNVYGISAIGGKLPRDSKKLLKLDNPEERIIVKEKTEISNDISLPLQWLLSQMKK